MNMELSCTLEKEGGARIMIESSLGLFYLLSYIQVKTQVFIYCSFTDFVNSLLWNNPTAIFILTRGYYRRMVSKRGVGYVPIK